MTASRRPLIGITMGDPAGIGPEIIVKALADGAVYEVARPIVIGDAGTVTRTVELLEARLKVRRVKSPDGEVGSRGVMDVIDLQNVDWRRLRMGEIQPAAGKAAFECVQRGVELTLAGMLDGIATAPVNKEALRLADVPFLDHTAMFAGLTECAELLTMFTVQRLKIFFVTRHVSLRQACGEITAESVFGTIVKADAALRRFGWLEAELAVAALNPHGGEHGLFGDEEQTKLTPAVAKAQELGINVFGPFPADSVFHRCLRGDFDAVISLYHDQGHIAAKSFDFDRTVSITTGLPFVRTSVDHGTAFDIAGKGIASSLSMEEALRVAAEYTLRARSVLDVR